MKNNCDRVHDNLRHSGACYSSNCSVPVKRHLEPVLVARVYYQPIVEELANSAMSLTLDNTSTISNAYTCGDCYTENSCDDECCNS